MHTMTDLQRRVMVFLENFAHERDPSGHKPPALARIDIVLDAFKQDADAGTAIHELEEANLIVRDVSNGIAFFGIHPAIVSIDGEYVIDPDLVCDRCGQVQSFACATGDCTR